MREREKERKRERERKAKNLEKYRNSYSINRREPNFIEEQQISAL